MTDIFQIDDIRHQIIIHYLQYACDHITYYDGGNIFLLNKLFYADIMKLGRGVPLHNGWYFLWFSEVIISRHYWTVNNQCRILRVVKSRLMLDFYPSSDPSLLDVIKRVHAPNYQPGTYVGEWIPYN